MRILIELSHPAHIHFFKNTIIELKKRKNSIRLVVRNKDINKSLIKELKIKNVSFLGETDSLVKKLGSLVFSTMKVLKISLKFRPDIFIGWNAIYSGFVAKILRKPFILFEDNEYTWSQLVLRVPLATKVITTKIFPQNFGKKHIRYDSYEELAYLHPNWFKINDKILENYGINDRKLIILRLISWSSTHDYSHHGLKLNSKQKINLFIKKLIKYGNVLLSQEGFNPFIITKDNLIRIASNEFHDFLGMADLYIGEGGTTAAEAAILGVPAIYTSTLMRSYLKDISKRYGLIFFSIKVEEIFQKLEEILDNKKREHIFQEKRIKLLKEKEDITKIIISIIEKTYRK